MENNENPVISEQDDINKESNNNTGNDGDHVTNNESNNDSNIDKRHGYKIVCAKLGLSMCVYFICRLLANGVAILLGRTVGTIGATAYSLIYFAIAIVLVYVVPLLFTAFIFKSFDNYKGKYRELYKKPKRLARAMGTFPATFGLGHGIVLLTLLASFLISRYLGGNTYISDLFRPTVFEPSTDIISVLTMVFMLVIIAPLFEEFLVRGIMYDALKPYGTGIAILISSILFGLMHGSLYMLFYTTAYGLALGYIRYATGSLFIVTILHAIVNSIGALALLLGTLLEITNEENRFINTAYTIYIVALFIMIIVGIAVFISKIPAIRKFKFENDWKGVNPWKKTAWFFISIPFIIMMIFAFNELSMGLLTNLVLR